MQDKRKQGFGNVRGNILLTVISVLLCIGVVFTAVVLWNSTPSAVPVLKRLSLSLPTKSSSQTSQQASSNVSSSNAAASSSSKASEKTISPAKDLDSALFVGDFYINGLSLYAEIDKKITYTNNNLSAGNILTREVTFRDKKTTVDDAAKDLAPKGIFIMLGSNDLAKGISPEDFSTNYGKLVDKLKEDSPNSHIYVQSVLPVTAAYSKKSKSHNNDNVNKYNEALKTLCSEKNVVYLDIASAMCDGSGELPAKSSSDGYHLKPAVYPDWITYIKNQK